ncbi:hypothetical protein ACFY2W_14855 [Streptomyces sp. NPDC001262]|uniref:hypothetical protein n=1 Tax=unclassified Streptomyces TaxID=2593676 RepID=UPI0036AF5629
MASPHQSSRRTRGGTFFVIAFVAIVTLIAGGLLWGKSNITKIKEWRGGNAWDLTYEAASTGGEPQATALGYRHNPDRTKPEHKIERLGTTSLPWSTQVTVITGEEARVEITPTGDATASCRILLDGIRVVAEGKSPGPGKPAVCHVTTSSTPEKWPR